MILAWLESEPAEEEDGAGDDAVKWFLDAMRKRQLGRKRMFDTMLAATYRCAGIESLLTLNAADFEVLGEFACVGVA